MNSEVQWNRQSFDDFFFLFPPCFWVFHFAPDKPRTLGGSYRSRAIQLRKELCFFNNNLISWLLEKSLIPFFHIPKLTVPKTWFQLLCGSDSAEELAKT